MSAASTNLGFPFVINNTFIFSPNGLAIYTVLSAERSSSLFIFISVPFPSKFNTKDSVFPGPILISDTFLSIDNLIFSVLSL